MKNGQKKPTDPSKTVSGQTDNLGELLVSAKSGNQRAYSELLIRYRPLISAMVNRYRIPDMPDQETEDLREEAVVSFCNAVVKYDTAQSEVDFGLYAKVCISNGLLSYLRDLKRRSIPTGELTEAEELSADPVASVIEEENFKALHALIEETLTEYENKVWWSYMSGMTAREIGESLGADEKSASNAIYRIRKKLRNLFKHQS